MKTIKELQKTPETNMMLEDGYLMALKDVLKLIDKLSFSIKDERLMDVCHVHELKQEIIGDDLEVENHDYSQEESCRSADVRHYSGESPEPDSLLEQDAPTKVL